MDKAMLNRATSSSDEPTPGYMLNEISSEGIIVFIYSFVSTENLICAEATLSSFHACLELQNFLLYKIKKDDPYSKYKCLVLLKVGELPLQ